MNRFRCVVGGQCEHTIIAVNIVHFKHNLKKQSVKDQNSRAGKPCWPFFKVENGYLDL